ncbi:MAG: bifunctional riboflavin kinase/FAD synthetase [Kiritimatiellae bacterium]|nr:bifunctional riboflavin kinase/FAD synthetase [Kiritimatiellia bacterium]
MRDAGRTGVAVGFFDGVHVAHRELLSQAAAAFTFRNHPLTVLDPDRAPSLILSAADRLARLRGCGLDEVVAVDFTRELADTAPEEFAASLLVLAAKFTAAGAPRVLCGPNWRFGRGGVGDAALLRRLGAEVVEVPFVEYRGEAISSTRIREAIERGEMEDAAAMLGRTFEADGEVFRGKGEGQRLGFPTVNVRPDAVSGAERRVAPPRGVYAVDFGSARAVANYGIAPTWGGAAWKEPVWELHVVDGAEAMPGPGERVSFALRRFIRLEREFASAEELCEQIEKDCKEAMK